MTPAVGLLPPLGETRAHFDEVRPLLHGIALVDLDRPVLGLSGLTEQQLVRGADGRPTAQRRTLLEDADRAAADLAAALGPGAPVVLVGASYGGLVARALAGDGRACVVGLMLVDSPHEHLARTMADLVGPAAQVLVENPERVDLAESFRQAGAYSAPGSLGDLPLVVLARHRGPWPGGGPWADTADRLWRGHQRMLLPLSSAATYEEVGGSGHYVCQDRPEVVADAVRRLVGQPA